MAKYASNINPGQPSNLPPMTLGQTFGTSRHHSHASLTSRSYATIPNMACSRVSYFWANPGLFEFGWAGSDICNLGLGYVPLGPSMGYPSNPNF
ncbi:hypothetical protein L873DRAFT_1801443 [Choiromyces venosus 120613-1]|uniref:Uncharacterized protein n=1 Tax=Choiromyces venosus 120613-1 TaxID=1336337 RepID=A0A3N4JX21_9PEZI|nr:hypothetical protein L873DRAFT_1801443 [Choiromyces venosus 120613-1]